MATPIITAITHRQGAPGLEVDLLGQFLSDGTEPTVTFGGIIAVINFFSPTQVKAVVPSLPFGVVDLILTTSEGSSGSISFTVTSQNTNACSPQVIGQSCSTVVIAGSQTNTDFPLPFIESVPEISQKLVQTQDPFVLRIDLDFSLFGTGPIDLGLLVAPATVFRTSVRIIDPFDGSATITVGDDIGNSRLQGALDNAPTFAGYYHTEEDIDYDVDTLIRVFTAGTPTQGTAAVYVYLMGR